MQARPTFQLIHVEFCRKQSFSILLSEGMAVLYFLTRAAFLEFSPGSSPLKFNPHSGPALVG